MKLMQFINVKNRKHAAIKIVKIIRIITICLLVKQLIVAIKIENIQKKIKIVDCHNW